MKVTLVTSSIGRGGGGVSEAVRLQALALSKHADITVLSLQGKAGEQDLADWGDAKIQTFRSLVAFGRFGVSPGLLIALLRSDSDIVHVHGLWQFPPLAVYIWSLVTGKPYVVTPHGMLEPWIMARSRWLKTAVGQVYQNRFLRRANAFHILTAKERSDVGAFLTDQIVEEIPNYVPDFTRQSERPGWWHKDLEERRIYLFFGRIHEKKGCMELADAWSSLCRKDPLFKQRSALVFCGWNDGLTGFEEHVAVLDREFGNIVFAGPQFGVDKARSLSASHFFVLPSKSEGLPMAILEAWSAGIPVIMTPECNLPVGFERNIAIRTGSSREAIAESLINASAINEDARLAMGRHASQFVASDYSRQRVSRSLLSLYRRCLGQLEHLIQGDMKRSDV